MRSLLIVAICLGGARVFAVSPAGTSIEELAESYKMSKDEFLESEAKKRKILASLYHINRSVKNITKHKTVLTDQLLATQVNMQQIGSNIAGLENVIAKQRDLLRKRLRVLSKFSGQGFVKTLFSNGSFHDLDRFLKLTKIVSERDYHLIQEYQQNIATYQHQKGKLSRESRRLLALKNKIRSQEDMLVHENSSTQNLLAQLDAKRLNQLVQMKALRTKTQGLAAGSERVDAALLRMFEPSFFEQKGSIGWPVVGAIGHKFGYSVDPEYQYQLSHKGWFFSTSSGAQVAACFPGQVAFVGDIDPYGKTIIVDHGHHYYTVYSNASDPLVKVGEKVSQNQKIAKAGWSVEHKQNGLYFEIRHFSEPEDPAGWLKLGVEQLQN